MGEFPLEYDVLEMGATFPTSLVALLPPDPVALTVHNLRMTTEDSRTPFEPPLPPPLPTTTTFLALPGMDTDEDVTLGFGALVGTVSLEWSWIPDVQLLVSRWYHAAEHSSHQCLPSPEPYALFNMNLLTPQIPKADEESRRMYELLKRVRDKEKVTNLIENIVEEEGG